MPKNAVIYCRVSSAKQKVLGDGLSSQETRCREFAQMRGYDVVQVFKDDASGSLIKRPGMQAMLKFLRGRRRDPHIVIIDDISRLARGVLAHWELRAAIDGAGGILESPSIEFGDGSDSQLVENMLASVSQHQRQKNGEQTKNRMRGRLLNGYWVFRAPIGYKYERVSGHGKMLVPDEPLASHIREALEGFASGRLATKAEVCRFLASRPGYPVDSYGSVFVERVTEMMSRITYAGYIEVPHWNVPLRKGHHQGLVSLETWQAVQARLGEKVRVATRTDINADFPLRGFVCCADCGDPLTANWTKGRSNHYPYYLCRTKGCASEAKSIARSTIEAEFAELLRALCPTPELVSLASHLFRDLWDQKLAAGAATKKQLSAELMQIERKIEQLLDRLIETDSASVVAACEKRVRENEEQKLVLAEKIARCGTPLTSFDESFRTALDFLGSPWKLWDSEQLEDKRAVLKLAFSGRLAYARNQGFRTAEIAFPFKMLNDLKTPKEEMVPATGIEPVAP